MKKSLTLLMVLMLALSLAGCGDEQKADNGEGNCSFLHFLSVAKNLIG